MSYMEKKDFEEKWKKLTENDKSPYWIIIITLNNETEIIANDYEYPYESAKDYYERDNGCIYTGQKDAIYFSSDNHDVAITRLSYIKDIRKSYRSHIQDYFETFDLCKIDLYAQIFDTVNDTLTKAIEELKELREEYEKKKVHNN